MTEDSNVKSESITLKEMIKRDIYLDFRTILAKRELMDNYPSPPNIKEFKSSIITFYTMMKDKLDIAIDQNKKENLKDLREFLKDIHDPDKLDIERARKIVPLLSLFLSEIGIMEIWD